MSSLRFISWNIRGIGSPAKHTKETTNIECTIEMVRQSEEVASQVSMQGEAAGMKNEVTSKRNKHIKHHGKPKGEKNIHCGKFGKVRYRQDENCPARKSTCNTCNKVRHWSRMCRSKKAVSEVTEQADKLQSYLLGALTKADGSAKQ